MTNEAEPKPRSSGRTRGLLIAGGVFTAIGLAWGAYYFGYGQFHESTDDAYVGANLVYVNAQVEGTVVALGAEENQPVKTGQMLVRLDKADSAVALADAEGRLGETVRQIRQDFRAVDASAAVVAQRKTDLARAEADLARRQRLAGTDALSAEDLAHAKDAVTVAKDAVTTAEREHAQALVPVEGTTLRKQPSVLRARAAYLQAFISAQRDEIPAPVDGFVARRTVQVGQRVSSGNTLLAVVPLSGAWVDANFKEPQLRNIRIGQPVTVSVDVYGSSVDYHGTVASISAGSGGAFSLLPPQNATGNWIKVVQRVPVRIALDPKELAEHPLRVGLSTEVTIDTTNRDGRVDTAISMPGANLATPVYDQLLKSAEAKADAIVDAQAGKDE